MAKGFEDTYFYRYNRFLALNEVGSDPNRFGIDPEIFHANNQHRLKNWPGSMITFETHDCKRSHDLAMRLCALSEMPGEWATFLQNAPKCGDPNFGYHFYQNLLGLYNPNDPNLESRLCAYALKAMREAKEFTSWHTPNSVYEEQMLDFVLDAIQNAPIQPLWSKLDCLGKHNTLSSIVLTIGAPGVLDIYQGFEQWQYNLVDPDNRKSLTLKDFKPCEKSQLLIMGLRLRSKHKKTNPRRGIHSD